MHFGHEDYTLPSTTPKPSFDAVLYEHGGEGYADTPIQLKFSKKSREHTRATGYLEGITMLTITETSDDLRKASLALAHQCPVGSNPHTSALAPFRRLEDKIGPLLPGKAA